MINLALGPDLPSVPMDDALNGRQSYSCAFELFSRMETLEHAEKLINIPHIKARAVVSDDSSA